MNIGLIVTVIDSDRLTGVERYALELCRLIPESLKSNVTIICSQAGKDILRSTVGNNIEIMTSPFRGRIATDQLWVPFVVRSRHFDFVYNATLSYPLMGYGVAPFAMMLHDATPWRYRMTLSRGMKYYYLPQLNKALRSKRLKGILTNSESSRAEIVLCCGVPDSKVYPVYLGIDQTVFRPTRNPSVVKRLTSGRYSRFLLTVGTIEPRKNLDLIFEAFALLSEQFPDLELLVVGREGWQKKLNIPDAVVDKITFTGYVSESDLVTLYSCASVFVFPSIYEGFGFPLLEAMACGSPVVASNASSLPEIGGAACLLADPSNSREFADQIRLILNDQDLRNRLVALGFDHVRQFSWRETMAVTWSHIARWALQDLGDER